MASHDLAGLKRDLLAKMEQAKASFRERRRRAR